MKEMTAEEFDDQFPKSKTALWVYVHWIGEKDDKCPNCQSELMEILDDVYHCSDNGKCLGHVVYRCPNCGAEFHKPEDCEALE